MPLMMDPLAATGELQYKIIDRRGGIHNLTRSMSPNLFIMRGSTGLGGPRFNIEDIKLPRSPGTLIGQINTDARTLELPIYIREDSFGDLGLVLEALQDWFFSGDESGRDPIIFEVTRPDDTVRQIQCYYLDGLEGDTEQVNVDWTRVVVKLYCPYPYCLDPDDTTVTKTVLQAASFSVMNTGDMDVFPIWTLHGPFEALNIINPTTDEEIGSSISLPDGDTLTIDTRPSEDRPGLAVYNEAGVSQLFTMSPLSVYFPLHAGSNTLQVTFTTTGANTLVELTFRTAYRMILL